RRASPRCDSFAQLPYSPAGASGMAHHLPGAVDPLQGYVADHLRRLTVRARQSDRIGIDAYRHPGRIGLADLRPARTFDDGLLDLRPVDVEVQHVELGPFHPAGT